MRLKPSRRQIMDISRYTACPSGRTAEDARLLGLRVRIPPEEWMSVSLSILRCHVEVSAMVWSLVQRSPTEFVCLKLDRGTSKMRKPTSGRRVVKTECYINKFNG